MTDSRLSPLRLDKCSKNVNKLFNKIKWKYQRQQIDIDKLLKIINHFN